MEERKNLFYLGIIFIVFVVSLFYLISKIGKWGFGGYKTYYAVFENTKGLAEKAEVRLAGVKVGFVDKIDFYFSDSKIYAKVVMKLRRDVPVRKDFEAQIRLKSLLGEKFVELVPTGTGDISPAQDGFTITKTKVVFEPDELIMSLEPFMKSLNPELISQLADLAPKLVKDIEPLIKNSSEALEKINQVFPDLLALSSDIKVIVKETRQLVSILSQNQDSLENLIRVGPALVENINSVFPSVVTLTRSINHTLDQLRFYQDNITKVVEMTPTLVSETLKLISVLNSVLPEFQSVATLVAPTLMRLNETLEKGVKVRIF